MIWTKRLVEYGSMVKRDITKEANKNLKQFLAIAGEASLKYKERVKNTAPLPSVLDLINESTTFGTVLEYDEESIIFENSAQSAVKKLEVTISSTQNLNLRILYRLHTKTAF